jgi:hypothetical protein
MAKKKATPASWKPGQSGNPAGRKPGPRPSLEAMRRILADTHFNGKPNKGGVTNRDRMITTLVGMAIAGDAAAANILLERTEGRAVTQKHAVDERLDRLAIRALKALTEKQTDAVEILISVGRVVAALRGQGMGEPKSPLMEALDRIAEEDARYGVSTNGDEEHLEAQSSGT